MRDTAQTQKYKEEKQHEDEDRDWSDVNHKPSNLKAYLEPLKAWKSQGMDSFLGTQPVFPQETLSKNPLYASLLS